MINTLIIDDEMSIRTTLTILLRDEGYLVDEASSLAEAVKLLDSNIYDLIISDLRLDDGDGTQILTYVKDARLKSQVIMLTAFGTVDSAVEAMKLGAYEYVTKPIEPNQLLVIIERAMEHKKLLGQVKALKNEFSRKYVFDNIVGKSKQMEETLDIVRSLSEIDVSVLIQGASGTGKELIAKAIHNNSLRSDGPIITINCSGLNEDLLDSELFGHVKGAFTGAISSRTGMFEESEGGTLFLDEVGTMSATIQAKLLRAIEEKIIFRLGSNKSIKVDNRIIAASNRDLKDIVKENKFREDLYYRLRVVEIFLPTLKERGGDIILLANFFLDKFKVKMNRNVKGFTHEAMDFFLHYPWFGNVRELEHCVESAMALCKSDHIDIKDIPKSISLTEIDLLQQARSGKMTLKDLEREYILETLKSNNWNQKKTAETLDIGRNTLWRKIKEFRLSLPSAD